MRRTRRTPFAAAVEPVPASSYWRTVNVTMLFAAGVLSVAVRPSVGWVAPVSGLNVVQ